MKLNRWPLLIAGLFVFFAVPLRAADGAAVKIVVKDDSIDFLAGDELVSTYHKGPKVAKPYMWPLYGPGGIPMTRAWPMQPKTEGGTTDHPHQKSVWFCHGDIIPEGVEIKDKVKGVVGVDYWAESPNRGQMVCTKVGEPQAKGAHGQVTTWNEWKTRAGDKILDETRTIHLYLLGDARLFVFDIDLAAVVPVTFGDTKEGSFGVRINDDIREDFGKGKKGPGKLENAEGKVGERLNGKHNVWGHISAWCDYSGPIQGKVVGLTIFSDPSNPPCCWHARGYGLMAANPFGRWKHAEFPDMKDRTDLIKFGKGEHLKLRYGVLAHTGDAKEGRVAERYQEFVKLK